jgi:site-specific DNA recombinase
VKVDGYIRVSKVAGRWGPSFISPQVQREQIERWASFKGAELLQIHVDLDESGGHVDRPGLQLALERVESGLSEGIVVAKLDRFARSLTGALETIRRLDEAGAAFVSVAEGLDPTTPAGKMMMRLMLVMAEFELDRMRETWDESRRRAVDRGIHIAGRLPIGYLRSDDGTLAPDPDLADRVASCFRMRAERRTWGEVVGFAKESGDGRPDEPAWTHRSLSLLMKNKVYVGEARSGAYRLPGAHEPIVDRGIFELVQLARTATAQPSGRAALLAGLLRCSGCGKSMTSGAETRRNGEPRPVYACRGKCVAGPCPRPVRLRGPEIEDLVQRAFFELYERSAVRRSASQVSRRRGERDLGSAETSLAEFDWSYPKESGDEETRRSLLEGIDVARARVTDLARSTLLESPARLHRLWPGLPVTERRRLMGLVMDAILIRPDGGDGLADQLLFVPFGMSGDGLPQPMRPAARVPYEWSRRPRRTRFAVLAAEDPAPAFC